ncbi:glutamate racemase [Bacteriovorax stolpii]|uniref:Glutamate racemase n=2 Tax=Bacteriovorax stolpii TaxID=960 RepID=A0A2K9NSN0_BACTC|nr:glutamate racemase [Bacteriovorax stolpii]AUN98497.1 glutamate racemase [Bacteriovorax stolpii]QDK41523.1 glutamate racemase [Bacteriovorax stolpii]
MDKKMNAPKHKIGVFDSGIGGFSVLNELLKAFPEAEYFYYSDDAHAPYGPKTDEYINQRTFVITDELISQGVEMIVVACNTATAVSIDALRAAYPQMPFVGVEPYLNAYYKETGPSKMAVLTTVSAGKSERFKRLKERLDPKGFIDHYSLQNLARMVEELYKHPEYEGEFDKLLVSELEPLQGKQYTHAILGCTHYPLVRNKIEDVLKLKTLSPCPYVAQRVRELSVKPGEVPGDISETFEFYSSSKPEWVKKNRSDFYYPFKK